MAHSSLPQSSPAGCAASARGWATCADRYWQEAGAFGLSAEQRQAMIRTAKAAEAQASKFRLMGKRLAS